MRLLDRLETRLLVTVCGVAAASIAVCAGANIQRERSERLSLAVRAAGQCSDTVNRSIHHVMLQNRWTDAFHIMDTIGQQERAHRVRVLAKGGPIFFSSNHTEMGKVLDQSAEKSRACWGAGRPLERLACLWGTLQSYTPPQGWWKPLAFRRVTLGDRGAIRSRSHGSPHAA